MPVPLILTAVSAVATVASTVMQARAAEQAAATEQATARYNQQIDESEANQIDLDTRVNIQAMRRDAAVYMSRQQSSFVRAGVNANTGSALAVRVATAGKSELEIQQRYSDALAKEDRLRSAGQAGIAVAAADASMYHERAVADVLGGAGKLAGSALTFYNQGGFAGGGPNTSANLDVSTEV